MRNRNIEDLTPVEILELMDKADARAMKAVVKARKAIAEASASAARAIGSGGRLIYVGAGTSGRLGVLDASECPPTFSSRPGQVTGLIAGGMKALSKAVEGAEDDTRSGRAAMARLGAGTNDMVLGISASGTTPYVLAAIEEALKRGAETWLLSCGRPTRQPYPSLKEIVLDTGPEVIQGSTRLAAGTATKLALNRITTAAFIKLGKVYGDLMVDVMPTNAKLVKRACGIITSVTGCGEAEALALLKKSGNSPKVAIVMKLKGLSRKAAERLLKDNGGFLREALRDG